MIKFKTKLRGKRIVLKKLNPTIDMAKVMFAVINANRKHLRPWFPWEKLTKTEEDSLKYLFDLEGKFKAGEKIDYGIYINDEYAGNIGAFDISLKKKSVEIGYWLSTKFIKKGYMTEALKVLEKELFLSLDLNRVQIKCDARNIASAGVAKKCNYFFEGKFRSDVYSEYFKDYRDTLVFSKLKSEFKKQK